MLQHRGYKCELFKHWESAMMYEADLIHKLHNLTNQIGSTERKREGEILTETENVYDRECHLGCENTFFYYLN